MPTHEKLTAFYRAHLTSSKLEGMMLKALCPFCVARGRKTAGTLVVFLNQEGYFSGYFRCLSRCVPSGFAPHFAKLMGLDPSEVPNHDPEKKPYIDNQEWPATHINQDIRRYQTSFTSKVTDYFAAFGVSQDILEELQIGFNGRYIVYPYFQDNGYAYTAHCQSPDDANEQIWIGNEEFSTAAHRLFNLADITHCEDGSLFLVEGEVNLLCLRTLGFSGCAVSTATDLDFIDSNRFAHIKTLFLVMTNTPEAEAAANRFAARVGFKVRILHWPAPRPRGFNLVDLAMETGDAFKNEIQKLITHSTSFSPFTSPKREFTLFLQSLAHQQSDEFQAMQSGMRCFDKSLGGIHGINIMGGAPKAGKSCFTLQLATEMARHKVPVIYYDFENGRQKILQRTLSRLSRVAVADFNQKLDQHCRQRFDQGKKSLQELMHNFRVVNDRQLSPQTMRRHVDFLRHETQKNDVVVVVDSLHKLPFKDFTERRTGIDAWLREFESIRDELQVAFLIISELNRQDGGRYDGVPHMGLFKGSGDIEYTADNAMIFLPDWNPVDSHVETERINSLWLVASREFSPGLIARYQLDFPFWGFTEMKPAK